MRSLRLSVLPPDITYILDGAGEAGEITGGAHCALQLYGDAATIEALFERPDQSLAAVAERAAALDRGEAVSRRPIRQRREGALAIERYAASLAADCSPGRRAAFMIMSAASLAHHAEQYAECLARWNYGDQTEGGCMQPFLARRRVDRFDRPTPRVARRLRSPKAIRRYVKANADVDHLRRLFDHLIRQGPLPTGFDFEAEREAIEQDYRTQAIGHLSRLNDARASLLDAGAAPLPEAAQKSLPLGLAARRRVKRGAAVAATVLGPAAVSAFARGEAVTLAGRSVNLAVSLPRHARLSGLGGHGSVAIEIRDPAAGARLAKLCVYHDRTPPLDQLAAFALRIQAGEEDEILSTGNLYAIEPAAVGHPALAGRVSRSAAGTLEAANPGAPSRRDSRRQLEDAYLGETMPIYVGAVRAAVFGRAAALVP